MKRIEFICIIFTLTLGCGDKNVTESAISISENKMHDQFCLQLNDNLDIEFKKLDSLDRLIGANDSMAFFLKKANERIFYLLCSMVREGNFEICELCGGLKVFSAISSDEKLAIFSWDTRLGGTMRAYIACAIYESNNTFKARWLGNSIHDSNNPFSEFNYASYRHIYSLIMKNGKTLYLPYGYGLSQTLSPWRTIKAFQISEKLEELRVFPEEDAALFCKYDFTLLNPYNLPDSVIEIEFLKSADKLKIPITDWGRPTGEFSTLIFDGEVFHDSSKTSH